MGQQQSYEAGLNCQLTLLEELPIGKIYKQSSSQTLHFIKEYAYTSEQAFQQAFLKFSAKLTTKNDNVLCLQKTNTKVDNTFCSTFYKIVLIFEFVNYSLADQILVRNKENRVFEEKEIWSILFHCTLGISHLKRTQGVQHSAIGLKDIKLSEDGTIKILPTEMVGISSDHDLNEGTTKKLAMTILSCILMKQVSNQSSEYLQALIDKTKCSKQLKKVLYFMVMDDTTFKELQEYLFKLANDQNDTLLSGVSTPMCSNQKKSIHDSNIKKVSQEPNKEVYLLPLKPQREDTANHLPVFENFEIENPDETDDKEKMQMFGIEENTIVQSLNEPTTVIQNISQSPTFANQNMNVDFKLKDYSASYDDVTVRMIGKKNTDFNSFSNHYVQEPQQKQSDLYTDPKLLDLIKRDLEEIQQKSRISYSVMKESTSTNFKMINAPSMPEIKEHTQQKDSAETGEKFKRNNSIYTMSSADFNIRPVGVETQSTFTQPQKTSKPQTQKIIKHQSQNPQGIPKSTETKKAEQLSTNIQNTLKQIDNVPKRAKEQQCYGNILDDDAGFRKAKSKKSTTTTATIRESQKDIKKDLEKQNTYESTQTKRIVQSYQKAQQLNSAQQKLAKNSQTKSTPQKPSQTSIQPQSDSSALQFVTETYQKGEYKGYKLNGLRHAHGTFYYREGGKYVGEWKQNKMNGKGTLYYPNDQIAYDGNWKDDQLHGYGTLYNEQVTKLERSFDYQDWSMVEEYWVKYEGEFSMDNKHGKGKLYLSNGQVFQGHFKEDMVDGEGVLNRDNGSRVRGIWRKNKLLRMY